MSWGEYYSSLGIICEEEFEWVGRYGYSEVKLDVREEGLGRFVSVVFGLVWRINRNI